MDFFSAASGLLGTIEVISEASIVIMKYVSSVKDAERSRRSIVEELESIRQTLNSFRFLLDDLVPELGEKATARDLPISMAGLYGDNGHLAQCHRTVEELLLWLQRDGGATKRMTITQRLTWPLHDARKADDFLKRLERQKTQFILALQITTGGVMGQISATTRTIAFEQQTRRAEQEQEERSEWITTLRASGEVMLNYTCRRIPREVYQ
jgi:hypothetical protein